jgi:hypothetical protein
VKANRTKELANSTSRKTFTNSTASNETFRRKQAEFDHRFELSAGPATILMLSFSIATFLAAFIQV